MKFVKILILLIFIMTMNILTFSIPNSYSISSYDYIIYKYGNTTNALNTSTGIVDYSGTISNIVFQNAFNNGHSFLVKSGLYQFNSYATIKSNTTLDSEPNAIIQRNYSSNTLLYFATGSSNLKIEGLNIDGNYKKFPNSSSDLDFEGNKMSLNRLNIYNLSHIGLAFEGNGTITNSFFSGNNDNTQGYCLHQGRNNTNTLVANNDFRTCADNGIMMSGDAIITGNNFYNNTFAHAGGVIDLVGKHVIVTSNIFNSAGRGNTGSVEVWSGCNLISNNIFIDKYTGVYNDRPNNCTIVTNNIGY